MRFRVVFLCLHCFFTGTMLAAADTATIRIDPANAGPTVNPRMYGIFLEEINHGVDGGLYGELVRNRAFEDARPPEGYELRDGRWVDSAGFNSGYREFGYEVGGLPFWKLVRTGDAAGSMSLETSGGITEESSYCLRLDVDHAEGGSIGIANSGFFGIGLKSGARFRLILYARTSGDGPAAVRVRLENADGLAVSDEARLNGVGSAWQQYSATLTATQDESDARLVIKFDQPGTLWLDFVSLFPEQTWRGRTAGLRADIAAMIADLKPGFVRFPGGCIVEGGTVETAYNWKDTVGPVIHRTEKWGPWHYRRTQGMGLHEYLQFCEDLGAEPLWVGFAGQTCIFRERENVPMNEMDWVRDNFLDLVEYANGPVDSKWGALRAEAGHPDPFHLKYIEIGNENAGPEYEERYRYIWEALHGRYPDLIYLADISYYRMPRRLYDVADVHYYNSPHWFLSRFHQHDGRDRNEPPLYLGEVAVTSQHGGPLRGNLLAALAEGVYLMGCERNADAVTMVSYAPLLAHVDGRTWNWHGMIYHDSTRAFGTASYYLWKLFGEHRPNHMLPTEVEIESSGPDGIAGRVGVGTWAARAEFRDIRVERNGEVLFASDFTSEDGDGAWETADGRWSVDEAEGVYRQGRNGYGLSLVGNESWSDYTLSLKARHLRGREGFLIVFGARGSDRYWWNLGGWGNQQHAIEMNQNPVGRPVSGTIESDRWYDIKIELNGRRIRCYLDGELVHDVTSEPPPKFFATAGRTDGGDLVIKAINLTEEPVRGHVVCDGAGEQITTGDVTVLTSGDLADNNSLDEPAKVAPTKEVREIQFPSWRQEFPPRSLSILRVPFANVSKQVGP